MKLGGIYVSVGAKTEKLAMDFAKAKGMAKKTAVLMNHELGRISFAHVGVAATAFGVVVAVGMKKAIDAASDLEETVGKFNVVFAKNLTQAESMAKNLVDSYAMSTREAKQYLSSVQDLLVPMGMVSDKAVLMSNAVVKLAADLGSFNNLPTKTVMLDIQSALVGNFETMKKYGVVLNETVIKQEALNSGVWDGKGMVDANTKAQIAFKLMLQGSSAAIGDQQRTMGSYANQMKQLKANIEDIAASVGNELLPQMTDWINQVNVSIKQNPEIIKQIGEFSKNLLGLVSTLGSVTGKMVSFYNVWVKTFQAMGIASTGMISWKEALTNGVEAVDNFNAGTDGLIFKIDEATEGFELYASAIKKVNNETEKLTIDPSKGISLAKKDTSLYENLSEPVGKDEWTRDNEMFARLEEEENKKLEIRKEFDEKYQELGLNQYDLERLQVERMAEIYREAGVDKNKIAEITSKKNIEIARKEQAAKLDIYQNMAGGIANTFSQIAAAGGKQSKKAFQMYKAFAMVEAAIAGYKSVLMAMSAYPPPISFVMAGVAGAAAAVQIGMIAKSQPPSYDSGGISNAKGIYQTGDIQEAHIPIPSGGRIPVKVDSSNGAGNQQPVNIILNNPVFQDIDTQRQVMAQIAETVAERVAPGAVVKNYNDDGPVRSMVRGGV